MYIGYVFSCSQETQEQCLRRKKYMCTDGKSIPSEKIDEGSVIFIFNSQLGTLLGPFTASEGGTTLETGAWAQDINEHSASANITLQWEELHLLQNASKQLLFLGDPNACKLSETQVQRALDLLKQAPLYVHEHTKQ